MGQRLILEDAAEDIKAVARQHGAKNVRIFGSYATGTATDSSDLDLLVDFEQGRDLFDLIGFKQEIESRLGIRVDVLTEQGMSPWLRDRILQDVRPL